MTTEAQTPSKHSYVLASIPLDKIERKEQVRKDWRHAGTTRVNNTEALQGLTDSIKQYGILQPVIVKARPGTGTYELIAGRRRVVTAEQAGEDTAPCIIWDGPDEDILLVQLQENLHRQNLSAEDEARAFGELLSRTGIKVEELARRLGISANVIRGRLRTSSDPLLRDAVARGVLAKAVASSLTHLGDEYAQPLRDRIAQGERLTEVDVEAVRIRKKEDGAYDAQKKEQLDEQDSLKSLFDDGLTIAEIATKLGWHRSKTRHVYEAARQRYPGWPRKTRAAVRREAKERKTREAFRLRAQGLTLQQIGDRLGCSFSVVSAYLQGEPPPPVEANVTFNGVSLDEVIADNTAPPPTHPRPTSSPLPWETPPAKPLARPTVTPIPVDVDAAGFVIHVHDPKPQPVAPAAPPMPPAPTPSALNDPNSPPPQKSAPPTPNLPAPRIVQEPSLADLTATLTSPGHRNAVLKSVAWASAREMTMAHLYDELRALWRS